MSTGVLIYPRLTHDRQAPLGLFREPWASQSIAV
jgi:hypothetical protein